MTTKEIQDAAQQIEHIDTEAIVDLIIALADNLALLEAKVQILDKALYRASNIASCLANGIQPD